MKRVLWGLLVVNLFSMVISCGDKNVGTGTSSESFGHLRMALDGCAPHYDVVGVQVKLFRDTTKACTDVADVEQTTDLICVPDPIADALFVLPTGDYKVCAIPVKMTDRPPYLVPSAVCSTVFSSPVTIIAEVVKEITLTSLCSNPDGGLDVITKFKDLVLITGLTILPNKFITTCEKATITITVDDPTVVNTYDWKITLLPPGSTKATLTQPDPTTTPWIAVFTPDVAGDYQLQVEVTNPAGNTTSLKEIPIHVGACACEDQTYSRSCNLDTDCVCGVNVITKKCDYGTAECIDASQQCPDFCTGIAGNLEIVCKDSQCIQVEKP